MLRAHAHRLGHVAAEVFLVVDDLHGPPAEHVGRAHQHGVADGGGDAGGLLVGAGGVAGRLREAEIFDQR